MLQTQFDPPYASEITNLENYIHVSISVLLSAMCLHLEIQTQFVFSLCF